MRTLKFSAVCGAFAAVLAVGLTGVAAVHAGDNLTRGRILFLRCASCHDVGAAPSAKIGPNLRGILGRKVASLPGYSYSAALRSQDFEWDAPHLDRWIRNPNEVAPGTMMAFAGIADESDRRAIIEYLQNQAVAGSGAAAARVPDRGAGP